MLQSFLIEVPKGGYSGITLVGRSVFILILEHLCRIHNVQFVKRESRQQDAGQLLVFSEVFR
jgi:hypothetical protein